MTVVEQVAAAICEGAPIDWAAAESSADETERRLLRQLRSVAEFVEFHATLHAPDGTTSDLHGSILHPSGEATAGTDSPGVVVPVSWGPLKILGKVGKGRFGDVYRAWDTRLDREVALKLLRRREQESAALESSVVEEGRLMAQVRHPNVITVYGAERIDDRVGLWMEFIHGRTLEQDLHDHGPFEASEVARIGIELCHALTAVHGQGLLHRDIKPQNVMRDEAGRLVLGDFGTGLELDTDDDDGTGHVAGTPLYLAPEIFARKAASVQSDLYSLGVLLYHLTTGSYPIKGRTSREVQDAHFLGKKTPLDHARADLPEPFVRIIERSLDPEPERRFESAAALETTLVACSTPVPGDADPTHAHTSRWWLRWPAAAAVLVAVTIGTSLVWVTPWGPADLTEPVASPDGGFEQGDSVLISRFENRTGNPLLDGTLEHALEGNLSDSRFLRVATLERVEDALRLMQLPVDTVIDASLGREVALRDGGIRVVLAGRIEQFGSRYRLTVQLLNPQDGAVLNSVSEDSLNEEAIAAALGRLASGVRTTLGEALPLIAASEQRLEKVTTPSLLALQLYSRGYEAYRGAFDKSAAAELFREAIAEDPLFASAYNMLGWSVWNCTRRSTCAEEAWLPYFERVRTAE